MFVRFLFRPVYDQLSIDERTATKQPGRSHGRLSKNNELGMGRLVERRGGFYFF